MSLQPDPAEGATRRRSDGQQTYEAILDVAVKLASIEGLAGLTIGRLARELDISKSGVFAHFRSKQRLQAETVRAAGEIFEREVMAPGLDAEEGLARLESLCEAYLSYVERGVFPGGCFFAHLLAEYDALEGPIHDEVSRIQHGWLELLAGLIVEAQRRGELRDSVDPAQMAFDLYGPLELANFLATLQRDPSFVDRGRAAVAGVLQRAR